ncbi:MAG: T9SS type A sorting domain-containing protein [Candidatus Azobacteroides sp.]|nr:T9SS type A sorting domain-containing protein [Candidatus Azobacteroides sp.]
MVNFSKGGTEGGSSGSPLISQYHSVIGQLHGGMGGCAPTTGAYGKFNLSWTGNNGNSDAIDSRRTLKDWLDPGNTNSQSLSGIMYNTNNIFFTRNIQQSSCACTPNNEGLGFNQYVDGPLSVCTGNFSMYFTSNKTNLTFSYTGPGSYNFSNIMGSGEYSIIGTFGNYVGNMVFFTFTEGSYTRGLSFNVGCNGVRNNTLEFSSVTPNPVSDAINISFDNEAITHMQLSKTFDIRLYDSSGILRKQIASKGENIKLNVNDLPDGLYFVHVYSVENSNPEIHKIIVKK